MACTASVASRPEYCFNRRSTDSGTVSSTSSVELRRDEPIVGHP